MIAGELELSKQTISDWLSVFQRIGISDYPRPGSTSTSGASPPRPTTGRCLTRACRRTERAALETRRCCTRIRTTSS
jgi:hypothetical protein